MAQPANNTNLLMGGDVLTPSNPSNAAVMQPMGMGQPLVSQPLPNNMMTNNMNNYSNVMGAVPPSHPQMNVMGGVNTAAAMNSNMAAPMTSRPQQGNMVSNTTCILGRNLYTAKDY